jgi:hypothetical protein
MSETGKSRKCTDDRSARKAVESRIACLTENRKQQYFGTIVNAIQNYFCGHRAAAQLQNRTSSQAQSSPRPAVYWMN